MDRPAGFGIDEFESNLDSNSFGKRMDNERQVEQEKHPTDNPWNPSSSNNDDSKLSQP